VYHFTRQYDKIEAVEPDTIAKLLLLIWESPLLKKVILPMRRRLRRGKTVVVVFGAGGVGKSTLDRFLSPEYDLAKPLPGYEELALPEDNWFKGDLAQGVIIAPGQPLRVKTYWPELYRKLATAKKEAILVFVGAYGHHTLAKNHENISTSPADIAKYVEICRQQELAMLEEVVSYFERTLSTSFKILSVIAKQDLWWGAMIW
jgi:hypothetical protein